MNKPEIKFPIAQEKIHLAARDMKDYIKFITHELKESLMQLELIRDWCSHPTYTGFYCNVCGKNTEEKENV